MDIRILDGTADRSPDSHRETWSTEEDVRGAVAPLRARIAELERALAHGPFPTPEA